MIIVDFKAKHIDEAAALAYENYMEEREVCRDLPLVKAIPDLTEFAENGLGVSAFENDRMTGFLCCNNPRENAFNSAARGVFSPIHAHGAVSENREMVYKLMYQAAAEKWVSQKIAYHSIGIYAHDIKALTALFNYGFGARCADAVRTAESLGCTYPSGIDFRELKLYERDRVNSLRKSLAEHMGKSPCFMYLPPQEVEKLMEKDDGDTRIFAALKDREIIAFAEIADGAENFITETESMKNICGAYCQAEYRGKGIYQALIDFTAVSLQSEGYSTLGVDFESFNPTADRFWIKYFQIYTRGLTRRIDECAIW